MSYDIGPKIGIEGDTQYKAALRAITSETKALQAEMKAVASSFADADSKETKLASTNKVLQKQISATSQQISILTKRYDEEKKRLDDLDSALQKAKSEFGENSEEAAKAQNAYNRQADAVNRLATQINNAKADFNRFSGQLRQNEQELSELGSSAEDSRTALQRLTDEISSQQSKMDGLQTDYKNAVLTFGKTSKEARKLAGEIKDLSRDLSENESTLGDVEGAAGKLAGSLGSKFAGAESAIAGAAAGIASAITSKIIDVLHEAVDAAWEFVDQTQQAMGDLEARTGATGDELERLGDVADTVYKHNFGESLSEVSEDVALVNQLLGDMPSDKMVQITEDAIGLSDAFDYDVSDSLRAAKALYQNFGTEGHEAYNLIAQGAQNGLDYSGELLDSIHEYSVQFKKAGFSAEDMFNIFESGVEAGAFNLDKIADAVGEFTKLAVDGSKSTAEGFETIGLNADEMSMKVAEGGNSAKQAFYETVQALKDMDDPLKQNQAGVSLFGTMWEDLGPDVITQLDGIRDSYDQTEDSMQQINDVQYDTLMDNLSAIGRVCQENLVDPIADALPTLSGVPEALDNAFDKAGDGLSAFNNTVQPVIDALGASMEPVRENLEEAWESLKQAGEDIAPIVEPLLPLFEGAAKIIGGTFIGALGLAAGVISALTGAASGLIEVASGLVQTVGGTFQIMAGIVTGDGELIKSGFDTMCGGIETSFGGMCDTVTGAAGGLFSGVSAYFGSLAQSMGIDVEGMKNTVSTGFGQMKEAASVKMSDMRTSIGTHLTNIKSSFSTKLDGAVTTVRTKMDSIKTAFSEKMESARKAVKSAIDKIKGLFNFSWSLPKLKLPHIKYTLINVPVLGTIPNPSTLHVEWYKTGAVFTSPTLFSTSAGLKGVGEAGPEAVLPLSVLWEELEARLLRVMENLNAFGTGFSPAGSSVDVAAIVAAVLNALATRQVGEITFRIVDGADRIIAQAIAPAMNFELAQIVNLEARGI